MNATRRTSKRPNPQVSRGVHLYSQRSTRYLPACPDVFCRGVLCGTGVTVRCGVILDILLLMKTIRTLPPKFLAAMIAVLPLPGSPLYDGDNQKVMDQALADLEVYKKAGVDSILFENDHDLPYIQPPLDEKGIVLMTKIVKEARGRFDGPIGIQMLEAANITSLEIAAEADLDYIRVEAYIFAHVGGSGIINGSAGKILRRRKELKAEHIKVFADVKKKHGSHSLTIDLDIKDEIMQAEFFLVDGVIVTSQFTGINPDKNDLVKAKSATKLPVLIGSGMTAENIQEYLPFADGFIVGSYFRRDGKFLEKLEPERLQAFMNVFVSARKSILHSGNIASMDDT